MSTVTFLNPLSELWYSHTQQGMMGEAGMCASQSWFECHPGHFFNCVSLGKLSSHSLAFLIYKLGGGVMVIPNW